jgi:hypothetical protein
VLEVIVRRANLQTTGSTYNKETQLLAYADDIDIVGRSQSAVQNAYLALEGEAAKVYLYNTPAHLGGMMILKRADIKRLGVSKILIWSLDITYQKSKKSMHARPCYQEPKFSSFCMETD